MAKRRLVGTSQCHICLFVCAFAPFEAGMHEIAVYGYGVPHNSTPLTSTRLWLFRLTMGLDLAGHFILTPTNQSKCSPFDLERQRREP